MCIRDSQARREVGLQGLGISDRAYQQAVAYAKERRQGRAVGAPKTEQSPIIEHPDVRRMLMTMKAYNEAARGLLYDTAACLLYTSDAADDLTRVDLGGR